MGRGIVHNESQEFLKWNPPFPHCKNSPPHKLTCSLTNSLALCSSQGAAAQRAPGTYIEELNWLVSDQGLEGQGSGQFSLGMEVLASTTVLCSVLISQNWQPYTGTKAELSINLASNVCPALVIPRGAIPPTLPTQNELFPGASTQVALCCRLYWKAHKLQTEAVGLIMPCTSC